MKITCKYQVLFGQVQVQVQVLWHFHTPSTQVDQVLINMYLSTSIKYKYCTWPQPCYIPHEMHILAHYFHTARITCGCVWKSLNMTAKNPQSNPVWPYIPHEMHMLAHYFHTARITCGCMWKNVNMNSKKNHGQIPCGITFPMKCTCSNIISTQQNQHVDACGKVWI